jgi:AcrR family transcriptional regulator
MDELMARKATSVEVVKPRQAVASGDDADSEERRRGRHDIPAEIIAATRKNFLRYGVNRTTMSDIARTVGMPRQTLYGYVSSREDLVDAVLVRRIQEIADDLKPLGIDDVAFDDALIETSLAAVERARNDPELMNIFTTGPADRVQEVVTGDYPEIHAIVANLLGPILDRGEKAGMVRSDKTRDEIVDWVRAVYLTLINQPATDTARERAFVADFLLPSIMFSRNDKHARH